MAWDDYDNDLFQTLMDKKAAVLKSFSSLSNDADFRVFIGNLPWKANEAVVRETFGKCGNIWSVKISTNPNGNKPKGFAHVEFENVQGVENALKLHNTKLFDRQITVARATPKPVSAAATPPEPVFAVKRPSATAGTLKAKVPMRGAAAGAPSKASSSSTPSKPSAAAAAAASKPAAPKAAGVKRTAGEMASSSPPTASAPVPPQLNKRVILSDPADSEPAITAKEPVQSPGASAAPAKKKRKRHKKGEPSALHAASADATASTAAAAPADNDSD